MGRLLSFILGFVAALGLIAFILSQMPGSPGGLSSLRDWIGPSTFDPLLLVLLTILVLATAFSLEAPRLGTSKEVALVSMVVALGAAGRLLFAAAPNVSPVDWLTLCTGMVFGPLTGFSVGASTMLVSNFWLGQGPWTPYQMLGMGLLGIVGGLLGRWKGAIGARSLAIVGLIWGFVYGVITTLFWTLMFSASSNWTSFVGYLLSGLPFFALQGVGNGVLLYFLGKRTIRMFERYKQRLFVSFEQITSDVGGTPVDL